MKDCENCSGHCGGCGGALTLTEGEIDLLETLAQMAFLPVSRTASDETPIYLGDDSIPRETASLILQCLEKRGLITIDYDQPLKGFDYADYHRHYHGSIGLTARGQQVIEMLQIQGICE